MADEQQIAAAALKLPAFWPADPEVWFTQVESSFATRGVTADASKFHYLVATLTPETATQVREILVNPPAADKYKTLKEAIIKRTTSSTKARVKQLLTAEQLDGRKPTEFLRRMRQLVGNNTALIPDALLEELFVNRLPSQTQAVIAASTGLSLDQKAELADKVDDVIGNEEVAELRRELCEVKQLLRSRAEERASGSQPRTRSKTPKPRPEGRDDVCWYHAKFASKAKKCREPCNYKQGNE